MICHDARVKDDGNISSAVTIMTIILVTPDTGGSVAVRRHDQRGDRGEVVRHRRSAVVRLFSEVFQPIMHNVRGSRSFVSLSNQREVAKQVQVLKI